uniref:Uncharacterized protein n=1 Tax=Nandayus nenday CRESS-DNA-virus sp. TaxID=2815047 RepID=A0A8A4XBR9_9VIRU|nr:MAG: hypothetical protein [Nandayus nenday CRESS-DNA-virus sp.]
MPAPWRFYENVQWLSSDDESEGVGGKPRDGEPGGGPGPGDVGGGTPWEPPLPIPDLIITTPTVITWNARDEHRLTGAEDWSGPSYTDETWWKGIPICLYNRKTISSGISGVCVGMRYGDAASDYDRQKHLLLGTGTYKTGGCKLRIPYYWDGVSEKYDPTITVEVPYRMSGSADSTFRIMCWAGTDGTVYDESLAKTATVSIKGPWTWTLDGTQKDSFVAGWNEFNFTIGYFRTPAGLDGGWVLPWYLGADQGYCWMITSMSTSMPTDHFFQFRKQINWLTEFEAWDVKVRENGTMLPGDKYGTSTSDWLGPNGHRNASNIGISYDSTISWDVYSRNPVELDDFWWAFPMRTALLPNLESQMEIIVHPQADTGPVGNPGINLNYFKYENSAINTAPPGGNRTWQGKNIGAMAMTWPPRGLHEYDNPGRNYHWFVPYNSKAMTYLVRGGASNDVLT